MRGQMTTSVTLPADKTPEGIPRRPLAITMGDPAGCGPQITARAWEALRHEPECAGYVIGDPALYKPYCPVQTFIQASDVANIWPHALPVRPIAVEMPTVEIGKPDKALAQWIISSIEIAVGDAFYNNSFGQAGAVVTNPISKAVLYEAGFEHPGHTEFLAYLTASEENPNPKPVMMLVGGSLRVALATIHMPLMKVGSALSKEFLIEIANITHRDLKERFGFERPRLVFTGLNPHAGENGTIGREEIDIINPAAAALRAGGIDIADARPGDTVFAEALAGHYDAVIAMTHDQGLIPVKTLDMWGGVNCTLGLPIIRTSPDHGTAYEAAAAGNARPDSLIAAIRLAAKLVDAK